MPCLVWQIHEVFIETEQKKIINHITSQALSWKYQAVIATWRSPCYGPRVLSDGILIFGVGGI